MLGAVVYAFCDRGSAIPALIFYLTSHNPCLSRQWLRQLAATPPPPDRMTRKVGSKIGKQLPNDKREIIGNPNIRSVITLSHL
jgi:hypothetical protein